MNDLNLKCQQTFVYHSVYPFIHKELQDTADDKRKAGFGQEIRFSSK